MVVEDGIQKECAGKAKNNETRCILLGGHFRFRIHRGDAIDQPLNGKTYTINYGPLPGKDPFHVPAQGSHQDGDDDHKQHVLNCAVEIHDLLRSSPSEASQNQSPGLGTRYALWPFFEAF